MNDTRQFRLDNGIRFVCEPMRHVRSLALGVWINAGSRDEEPAERGLSHFLEHMHFKGTRRRTARAIADAADAVGGELNAYTSRESTTFYARVLDEHTGLAVDLLSDILLESTFPGEEVERERQIILEEIRMVEDTPDDYIHDLYYATALGDRGLGAGVLGTPRTVEAVTRETLLAYRDRRYTAENILIAAAGRMEPERLRDALDATFGRIERRGRTERPPQAWPPGSVRVFPRELAEAHLCLGFRGLAHDDPDRYAFFLLNTMLGSGASSRLFQEIREKRALAYSIYSFVSSYSDTGVLAVYAGTRPDRVREVVERILVQCDRFRREIDGDALQRAREQLKGNLLLGLESTAARMNHIARNQICFGRQPGLDEILARIDAVGADEVRRMAERIFRDDRLTLTVLGPVDGAEISRGFRLEEVSAS